MFFDATQKMPWICTNMDYDMRRKLRKTPYNYFKLRRLGVNRPLKFVPCEEIKLWGDGKSCCDLMHGNGFVVCPYQVVRTELNQ